MGMFTVNAKQPTALLGWNNFMNLELFKPELSPQSFTSEQLGAALDAAEMLESKIRELRKEAHKRAESGQAPAGWHLVPTEGKTKVLDPVAAEWALRSLMPSSEFLACCSPRVGELVQAIKDREDCTIEEAKAHLKAYLGANLGSSNESGEKMKLERIPKQIEAKAVESNPAWIEKLNESRGPAQLGKTTHSK
jgi:hypothetical protein